MKNSRIVSAALLSIILAVPCHGQTFSPNDYAVLWNSPSKDETGQMPLGNGDIAAGVYALENGSLYLLLAKNDALTYQGDLFKTGRVRINISPNPFATGLSFRQEMDMEKDEVSEMIGEHPDPYVHNTFGNLLESPDLEPNKGKLTGSGKSFDIRIHSLTKQTEDPEDWIKAIQEEVSKITYMPEDFVRSLIQA